MSLRFSLYSAVSVAAFAGTACYGWQHSQQQFFPTMVWMWTSKPALIVLLNLGLMCLLGTGLAITRLFLGKLRPAELTELSDQLGMTVTDTLLAMTIFRSEFDLRFLVLFACLIFLKTFHWVLRMRVAYVAQTASMTLVNLVRLAALTGLLLLADVAFLWLAFASVIEHGPSVMILFAFESTLLACAAVCTAGHFVLNVVDLRHDGQWRAKSGYELYLDFVAECFNMLIYTFFFAIVLSLYGMPLHLIRQIWWTWQRFAARVREVINWRKAMNGMNERYPDVTLEELRAADEDTTCIICREELDLGKRLPCGHVLHRSCLMDWLQRKQTCPICRVSVLVENITDPTLIRQGPANNGPDAGPGGPDAGAGAGVAGAGGAGGAVRGVGAAGAAFPAVGGGTPASSQQRPGANGPRTPLSSVRSPSSTRVTPFTPDPATGMSPLQSIQVMSAQIQMIQLQLVQLHNQLLQDAEGDELADQASPFQAAAPTSPTPSTPSSAATTATSPPAPSNSAVAVDSSEQLSSRMSDRQVGAPMASPALQGRGEFGESPGTPSVAENDEQEAEMLELAIQASLADKFNQESSNNSTSVSTTSTTSVSTSSTSTTSSSTSTSTFSSVSSSNTTSSTHNTENDRKIDDERNDDDDDVDGRVKLVSSEPIRRRRELPPADSPEEKVRRARLAKFTSSYEQ